jgi:hypothetical protein
MEDQQNQIDSRAYQDAEIVDYGSASEIVQNTGSGALDDGSGAAFYSS